MKENKLQKIYKSINILLINNNEPFIKYDCQTKYVLIYNGELLNKDELLMKKFLKELFLKMTILFLQKITLKYRIMNIL